VNGTHWGHEEEVRLTEYLIDRLCAKATGRSETECLHNYPRDVYFIGNLRPRNHGLAVTGQPVNMQELLNKMSPVAFGAEFLIQVTDAVYIKTTVRWNCYYRIFPTLEQQRQHQRVQMPQEASTTETTSNEDLSNGEDREAEEIPSVADVDANSSLRDRRSNRISRDSLFVRFNKVSCEATGEIIIRRHQNGWGADIDALRSALEQETSRAQALIQSDANRVRTNVNENEKLQIPITALESEERYAAFRQTLPHDIIPQWSWDIRCDTRVEDNDHLIVSIQFVNTTGMPSNSPNVEPYLFDTKAFFQFEKGQVFPFQLNLAPKGFRYDRYLWGKGLNCSVDRMEGNTSFGTTHTPIYRQLRYVTQNTPVASFVDLARDPIPVLRSIHDAMTNYIQRWVQARQHYSESGLHWSEEFGAEFDRDKRQFESEIARFQRGLQLIISNEDIRRSFQLTNETFSRGDSRKTGWRLFQIVFLVTQIPGIAALARIDGSDADELEKVDIIYFPTGGGKTEAYLGVIVFQCFFDRLRGKSAGVTAWTRFPLRLLTIQQTQRVADVIGVAELVRREQSDPRLSGCNIDGFAVGYFVGQGGSPNEIADPGRLRDPSADIQLSWSQANDSVARQHWKRVVRCPSCRTTSINVDFEPNSARIMHRCSNSNCGFPDGIIPVYIVDNEVYRYLPSVIVGTIDKLAGIGNQRKLSLVFGQVDGRCRQHGYYKIQCCQKECRDTRLLQAGVPNGMSGPTLFIQDELHLLKEGLGTFDSHYETFVQRLQREFGQSYPLKIIASSATIEAFERQIEHLYGRNRNDARVFPSPGPALTESFYAITLDHPQRLFVGIIPHNKTIFNTILELIEYCHREIQLLQRISTGTANPYGGILNPGTNEYMNLLDFYSTTLTYFLVNRQLNEIHTDLEGDVNPNLHRDGLLQLSISELTGSATTNDVSRILEHLERSSGPDSSPDTVLATSMVSHGVDVDRFNTMIFYGMPRQNSEYIQASSRVGRSHIGIVFSCLHPVRERDQSHYSYFVKFHEFLGQLVEPVAINRWSKFSVNRTLPGLFMGVLLQLIANNSGERSPGRYYMLDFLKQKISDGSVRADDFIPLLEEAYQVETPINIGESAFRDEIRLRVQQFLDQIINAGPGNKYVSDVLIPRPMRSLRDVDEPIEIRLDSTGRQWSRRARRH
jgi:Helicase conserved C-terminal domain